MAASIRGGSKGRGDWGDFPPKTSESNFSHHDFVEIGKQHSRYKAILSSIVLSQQCCKVYYIYSSEPIMRLDYQILLKSLPPPKLTGWIRPWRQCFLWKVNSCKGHYGINVIAAGTAAKV